MNLVRRVFTERRAVVLPLMVFLLANVGVLALGVFPLERSVAGLQEGEVDALAARGQALKIEASAKAAQLGKERAETELRKFYGDVLPESVQEASELTYVWLDSVAKESGVEFSRSTFKEDEYPREPAEALDREGQARRRLRQHPQVPLRRGNRGRVRHHRGSRAVTNRSDAWGRLARARVESGDDSAAIPSRSVPEVKLLASGPQRNRQLWCCSRCCS